MTESDKSLFENVLQSHYVSQDSNSKIDRDPIVSDLTADELILTENFGFEPLSTVTGTSVFHINQQLLNSTSHYLENSSNGYLSGFKLALSRIKKQAENLNAHGIIGLKFDIIPVPTGTTTFAFMATGTAVNMNADNILYRFASPSMFMTTMSAQELFQLAALGYRPVTVV